MNQGPGETASIESRVTIAGCLYWAVVFTYYLAKFSQSPGGILYSLYGSPFVLVFVLAAVGVWKKPKAGFITAVAISGVSLIEVGPYIGFAEALSGEGLLAGGATANGVLFVTLFFSLFGARKAWGRSVREEVPSFTLGRSAAIGALVFLLLFVASSVAYGITQTKVYSRGDADIIMPPGSAYITSNQFYLPQTFHAKVGQPVTWKNLDTAPHTVRSVSGLFQSGNMDGGSTYSYTFTQPGTYHYTCDYHWWMDGAVVVVSG